MIGVIADDVTGATDVAAALSRAGLRTLLSLTVEPGEQEVNADAIVIGLKTRSLPPRPAVELSRSALRAAQRLGADRFYVKYCSTFDSTPDGNIGPVTEALAAELGVKTVVTTPAAPIHGRTVYQGHLFVGDTLLSETHMRDHPVTPMRDSSLLRLLQPQASGNVALLPFDTVRAGTESISRRITAAESADEAHLIADAVSDTDLQALAAAIEHTKLAAGSAGLIAAIASRHGGSGAEIPAPPSGLTTVIAGSCSARTLEQIDRFRQSAGPSFRLEAGPGDTPETVAGRALEWWDRQPADASTLIYSSRPASERAAAAAGLGQLYEEAAGLIAMKLAERGVRRMLIAGGETSGAVTRALGTRTAMVGREAAIGVPWVHDTERDLHLVLKSGNFGPPELFVTVAQEGVAS